MKISPTLALFLWLGGIAFAQQAPHLAYVYPAGGKPGSTFTVVMGGQFLSGITNFVLFMDGDCARGAKRSFTTGR